MHLKIAITLAIVLVAVVVKSPSASAQSLFQNTNNSLNNLVLKKETKQKPKIYKVKQGDTLSTIAKTYDTSWQRLYYKNLKIDNPDNIKVNSRITIPRPNEKLKKRNYTSNSLNPVRKPVNGSGGYSTAGNTYAFGYCTYYAKNRRPDIPNRLGNANLWYTGAANAGLPVGYKPRVGAVGVAVGYTHVVYIEKVKGNRVFVSEMNYNGWNVTSSRWTSASEFRYIY